MRWTKSENVVWEELDGGALLIDTKSGTRWTLSTAAAAAWKLCDGTHSIAEMTRLLRQRQGNITDFCRQFESLGLLKNRGAHSPAIVGFRSTAQSPFNYQSAGLGSGPRRRPSPRGNSVPG
ncbi:MAG: PqqD family protein [Planctomycetota bacterium]